MKKAVTIILIFLGAGCVLQAQDKVIKNNNEEVLGKIILFQNGKFTLLLPDKSELTLPKDAVRSIVFDTTKCSLLSVSINTKDEDMDPACADKGVGNVIIINETGEDIYFYYWLEDDENSSKRNDLSASKEKTTFYGIKAGSYKYSVQTKNTARSLTGGFYVPVCKPSKIVYIKTD